MLRGVVIDVGDVVRPNPARRQAGNSGNAVTRTSTRDQVFLGANSDTQLSDRCMNMGF